MSPAATPDTRFDPTAADAMRRAVREADGVEVFAIGRIDRGRVAELEVAARGQIDRVLAILGRPRSGQVVIHNHPSGDLTPSDADLHLASRFSEDGVGFVVVDSAVSRANWVVEPWDPGAVPVDRARMEAFFREDLPAAVEGWEVRDAQLRMAHLVADTLDGATPLLVEAGTGTGKSLAYLVPAALWALANQRTVVVSTHTRALQAQLLRSDLPLLARGGLEVRSAVLEGRNNYLCKRRLGLAREEAAAAEEPAAAEAFAALIDWAATTRAGSRSELGFTLPGDLWERVQSDTDLTLRMRCEHYEDCHFYTARREAARAHVLVVNHALLTVDLVVRQERGQGILPRYERVILDEAHHLEDVATGIGATRVTRLAVRRAVSPLLPRKKRQGALARAERALDDSPALPAEIRDAAKAACRAATVHVESVGLIADQVLGDLVQQLDPEQLTRRVTAPWRESPAFDRDVVPPLEHLAAKLDDAAGSLTAVEEALGDHSLPARNAQPLLDLGRAVRRLTGHALAVRRFLEEPDGTTCRWIALERRRHDDPSAAVVTAPLDAGPLLKTLLWEEFGGTVCTSATLTTGGTFAFWQARHGLDEAATHLLPSPFDHYRQALLGLPRDLPEPNAPDFLRVTARAIVDAVEASDGGAFVLCTSYRAVDAYAAALSAALPPGMPVLAQGTAARGALLDRFRQHPRSVLVGTDSFWEGVSVKGDGLRLVIIPRLPFRRPDDPLQEARHERLVRQGVEPFRALTLPQAILKVRQGYGRLIRSPSDTGVVLLLDRRLHDKAYGRVVLASLPPARRLAAPWARVLAEVRQQFAARRGRPPAG